jgi:site-specific recombinase XerD
MRQVEKIRNHNRQGSFESKKRYFAGIRTFCGFLAEKFSLEKFANISDKHLSAYITDMQSRSLSPSTIKTNLSAIRFYHDKIEAKHRLSPNEKFNLEQRHFGGVNRSWTVGEYTAYLNLLTQKGRERDKCIMILGWNEGVRIHEACWLDRSGAEKAIKSGILHVKGKGGLERDIPLSSASRQMLTGWIKNVERGQKLFVREGEKTHLIIKQVQNYINDNRAKFQDPTWTGPNRTFHGLRHHYASEQYNRCLREGMKPQDARRAVSELLGHQRDEVTRIYLAK